MCFPVKNKFSQKIVIYAFFANILESPERAFKKSPPLGVLRCWGLGAKGVRKMSIAL